MSSVCADTPAVCQAKGYRSRELPPSEWGRLTGTELGPVAKLLTPHVARVLVVENGDGAIVACWALLTARHLEGAWIDPAHRGATAVQRSLWGAMRRLLREVGVTTVLTSAVDASVAALVRRHGGVRLPGEHFVWNVEER